MSSNSHLERFLIDQSDLTYRQVQRELEHQVTSLGDEEARATGEILGHLAEAHRRLGNLAHAIDLFWKAYSCLQNVSAVNRMCWCLWGIGTSLRMASRFDGSRRLLKRALAMAKEVGERRCQAWSYAEIAEIDRICGYRRKALKDHSDLLQEFKSLGDIQGVGWAHSGIGQILRMESQFSEAQRAFLRAERISESGRDAVGVAWALRGQAEIAKEGRDLVAAEALGRKAADIFREKGYPTGQAYVLKTIADVELLSGDILSAMATARSSVEYSKRAGEVRALGYSLKALADIETSAGLYSEANSTYKASFSNLRNLNVAASFDPIRGLWLLQTRIESGMSISF